MEQIYIKQLSIEHKEFILSFSNGIYDGFDYLRFVYDDWAKDKNRYMFGIEINNQLVGFESICIIDNGSTILSQALRIHNKYRGLGLSTKFIYNIFK